MFALQVQPAFWRSGFQTDCFEREFVSAKKRDL
jgi:hypothetical protein